MAEFRPREFYYHSCEARQSTEERLTLPLHYYLKRGDLIALRRTLRTGAASPLLTDEYGKTILDICLDELDEIFVTGFCTSFPIDDLIASVTSERTLTRSKFYLEDENELWAGVYEQHEKALYKTFNDGSPNLVRPIAEEDRQRYLPQQHKGYPPSHLDIGKLRAEAMVQGDPKPSPPRNSRKGRSKSSEPASEDSRSVADSSVTDGGSVKTEEQHQHSEQAVLVAVSGSLSKPLSARVRIKLQKLIRRLRVYLALCEELCSCEDLVTLTMSRRQKVCELMEEPKNSLVLTNFRLPFLYISTMRLLLELYPAAPDGVQWRATSPIDLRVLAGLVCRLELPGHFILLFLAEYASALAKYLLVLPPYRPSGSEEYHEEPSEDTSQLESATSSRTANSAEAKKFIFNIKADAHQYLFHSAFVLDCPELFDILSVTLISSKLSLRRSIFDWQGTLADLQESYRGKKTSQEDEPAGSMSDVNIERYISILNKLLY